MPRKKSTDTPAPSDLLSFVDSALMRRFTASLTAEQQLDWHVIHQAVGRELAVSRMPAGADHRDGLYHVFQQVQGKITAEKLEALIDNAVDKGDAQTLRVLALMAGVDLTERPHEASGEGARVIFVKPHPRETSE